MTRDDIIRLALMGERSMKQRIEWAVDMEREECAKICGRIADSVSYEPSKSSVKCYEAIRARGLTSLQRQLIDAETLQSDPAGLKARGQV
jgi:hypothetical protein